MKIAVIGKEIEKLKKKIKEKGFQYDKENPEIVICYGGDGIFLIAERVYPGIPKVLVKRSPISNKGHEMKIEKVLEKFSRKEFEIQKIKKLKAIYQGTFEIRNLVGVNDIVIRNSLPTEALRFKLQTKNFRGEFIGDGLVVATSYGSSQGAYFYSITGKEFEKGLGIAFNNVTKKQGPKIISEKGELKIKITRGPGVLVADNNRDYINLERGDKIKIFQTNEIAKRIILK
jgi:NAD+ kinase